MFMMPFLTPDAAGTSLSTPLVSVTGSGFVPRGFAQDSREVNHSSLGDAGAERSKRELNTHLPRGAADTDAVIQATLNGNFVVLGRDSNGNYRVGGDHCQGVKSGHNYKSVRKGIGKKGTDFKVSGGGFTHVPYYYTAAIPLKGRRQRPWQSS